MAHSAGHHPKLRAIFVSIDHIHNVIYFQSFLVQRSLRSHNMALFPTFHHKASINKGCGASSNCASVHAERRGPSVFLPARQKSGNTTVPSIISHTDTMTDQDQDTKLPLPDMSTEGSSYRQTASAFRSLESTHDVENPNSSSTNPETAGSRVPAPAYLAPNQQPHQLRSESTESLVRPTPGSSKMSKQWRGSDWVSWKSDQTDKLDDDARSKFLGWALRKVGDVHGRDMPTHKPAVPLRLSGVQPFLVYSPQPPLQPAGHDSPVSLGPQSSRSSHSGRAASPQPPSPDQGDLPKYLSAFEYAIRPYLEKNVGNEHLVRLPLPPQREVGSDTTLPLLPPLRDDEISYNGSEEEEMEYNVPEDGIPAHLKEKDNFMTRMRHVQLRILLMRCMVLQSTVRDLERRPRAQESLRPPYWYYSKMRHLAHKARNLAEALESRDLQARCEYWAGRACGGTRDYYTAAEHFEMAIKLDVQNEKHPGGGVRLRGLKPNEKEDVRFLWDSVSSRHDSFEKKTANARKVAQYESDRTGKLVEDCIDWDGLESPSWAPDRDRVVYLARREFGIRRKLGSKAEFLDSMERERIGEQMERRVKKQWDEEGLDEGEITRRVLDDKEWRYIRHGDEKIAKLRARQVSDALRPDPRPSPGRPASITSSSSPSSSHRRSEPASPIAHFTLEQELEQTEWSSRSPTPPLSDRSPTTPSGLQHRRKISIEPISTGNIQKRPNLGRAVHGSPFEASGSDTGDVPIIYDDGSSSARRFVESGLLTPRVSPPTLPGSERTLWADEGFSDN
jgi:hypothetical protein